MSANPVRYGMIGGGQIAWQSQSGSRMKGASGLSPHR